MARGDFRSTTGQVISSGQRQIHNTSSAVNRARSVQTNLDPIANGVNNGIRMATNMLQREATLADRKAAQEAGALDNALLRTKNQEAAQLQQQKLSEVLTANPELSKLSTDEFLEQVPDFPQVDYSGIKNPSLVKIAQLEERSILTQALQEASYRYDRAEMVNGYTQVADMSARSNYSDFDELMAIAKDEGLSDEETWMGLASSALTASNQGNFEAASVLIQKANDIKSPELRDAMIRELSPLANATKRAKETRTTADYNRMKGIRTIEELQQAQVDLGDKFDPSAWSTVHARVDKHEAKRAHQEEAFGVFNASGYNFQTLQRELSRYKEVAGAVTGNAVEVELSESEVDRLVDQQFERLYFNNPDATIEALKGSTFIPKAFKRKVKSALRTGFLQGMENIDVNDMSFLESAIQLSGGDENPLGASAQLGEMFGLEGQDQAIMTQALTGLGQGIPLEASFERAIAMVQHTEQYGTRGIESDYQTLLNEELDGHEDFTPEQRLVARNMLYGVKSHLEPDAAVELAIQAAENIKHEVDIGFFSSQGVVRGRELQVGLDIIREEFTDDVDYDVMFEELLEGGGEDYDESNVAVSFNPKYTRGQINLRESVVTLSLPNKLPRAVPLSDLQDALREKHGDKTKAKAMDYDNEYIFDPNTIKTIGL
jgi:hypothetical protein